MAIELPTLVQRVRVDTRDYTRAEAASRRFGSRLDAGASDASRSVADLGDNVHSTAQETEGLNTALSGTGDEARKAGDSTDRLSSSVSGLRDAQARARTETRGETTDTSDLRRAQLRLQVALDGVGDAHTRLARARQGNDPAAIARGELGVVDAMRRASAEQDHLAQVTRKAEDSTNRLSSSVDGLRDAQARVRAETRGQAKDTIVLRQAELRLQVALGGVRDAHTRLTQARKGNDSSVIARGELAVVNALRRAASEEDHLAKVTRTIGREAGGTASAFTLFSRRMEKAATSTKVFGVAAGALKFPRIILGGLVAAKAVSALGAGAFVAAGQLVQLASAVGAAAFVATGQLVQLAGSVGAAGVAMVGQLAPAVGVVASLAQGLVALKSGTAVFNALTAGPARAAHQIIKYGVASKQAQTALATIGPEARRFAFELVKTHAALDLMIRAGQKAALPGLGEALSRMRTLAPIVTAGFTGIAKAISSTAVDLAKVATSGPFRRDLGVIVARNTKLIQTLGQAFIPLVVVIKNVLLAAGPMTQAFAEGAVRVAKFLAAMTSGAAGQARLTGFFAKTQRVVFSLAHTLINLGAALIHIGSIGANSIGIDFVGGLERLTKRFNDFTKSATGASKIAAYFKTSGERVRTFAKAIGDITVALVNMFRIGNKKLNISFGGGLARGAAALRRFTESAGGIEKIGGFFQRSGDRIRTFDQAIRDVSVAFANIFRIGNKKLDINFGGGIAAGAAALRAYTESGPGIERISGFFDRARPILQEIGKVIGHVATALFDFKGSLPFSPILLVVEAFGKFLEVITKVISVVPGLGTVVALMVAFSLASKGLLIVGKLTGIGSLVTALGAVGPAGSAGGKGLAGLIQGIRGVDREAAKAAGTSRSFTNVIGSGLRGAGRGVGRAASGIGRSIASGISSAISGSASIAKSVSTALGKAATSVGSTGLRLGKLASSGIGKGLAGAGRGLSGGFGKGLAGAGKALGGLGRGFRIAAVAARAFTVALLANPIFLIVAALVLLGIALVVAYKKSETFRNIVNGAFSALVGIVTSVVDFIRAHWQLLVAIFLGPIGLIVFFIAKHFSQIVAIVTGAINVVNSVFTTGLSILRAIVEGVLGAILTYWQFLFTTVVAVVSTAFGIVNAVFSAGFSIIKTVVKAALAFLVALFTGNFGAIPGIVSGAITNVLRTLSGLGGYILNAVGDLGHVLYNAGVNLIQGLLNGIGDMVGKLFSAVGDLGHGIVSAFNAAVGNRSPSKKFRAAGVNLGQGLQLGIDAQLGPIRAAAKRMATAATPTLNNIKAQLAAAFTPPPIRRVPAPVPVRQAPVPAVRQVRAAPVQPTRPVAPARPAPLRPASARPGSTRPPARPVTVRPAPPPRPAPVRPAPPARPIVVQVRLAPPAPVRSVRPAPVATRPTPPRPARPVVVQVRPAPIRPPTPARPAQPAPARPAARPLVVQVRPAPVRPARPVVVQVRPAPARPVVVQVRPEPVRQTRPVARAARPVVVQIRPAQARQARPVVVQIRQARPTVPATRPAAPARQAPPARVVVQAPAAPRQAPPARVVVQVRPAPARPERPAPVRPVRVVVQVRPAPARPVRPAPVAAPRTRLIPRPPVPIPPVPRLAATPRRPAPAGPRAVTPLVAASSLPSPRVATAATTTRNTVIRYEDNRRFEVAVDGMRGTPDQTARSLIGRLRELETDGIVAAVTP